MALSLRQESERGARGERGSAARTLKEMVKQGQKL